MISPQKQTTNLTIGQTLGLGFGTICVLIFLSNIFSQWSHHRKSVVNKDVVLAYQIEVDLLKLETDILEAENHTICHRHFQ